MDISSLHNRVLADCRGFTCSFLLIADERGRAFMDRALEEEQYLWRERLGETSFRMDRSGLE